MSSDPCTTDGLKSKVFVTSNVMVVSFDKKSVVGELMVVFDSLHVSKVVDNITVKVHQHDLSWLKASQIDQLEHLVSRCTV